MDGPSWLLISTIGGVLVMIVRSALNRSQREPVEDPDGLVVFTGPPAPARALVDRLAEIGICAWTERLPDSDELQVAITSEQQAWLPEELGGPVRKESHDQENP